MCQGPEAESAGFAGLEELCLAGRGGSGRAGGRLQCMESPFVGSHTDRRGLSHERLPKLCLSKPVTTVGTRVFANISKPWKAKWAPPKAITLVCTFRHMGPASPIVCQAIIIAPHVKQQHGIPRPFTVCAFLRAVGDPESTGFFATAGLKTGEASAGNPGFGPSVEFGALLMSDAVLQLGGQVKTHTHTHTHTHTRISRPECALNIPCHTAISFRYRNRNLLQEGFVVQSQRASGSAWGSAALVT